MIKIIKYPCTKRVPNRGTDQYCWGIIRDVMTCLFGLQQAKQLIDKAFKFYYSVELVFTKLP